MGKYFLSMEEAIGDEQVDEEQETALQDQVSKPEFKQNIEKLFYDFYNALLLNETKSKLGLTSLLDNLNLEVESRTGAKFKSIVGDTNFVYYLDHPMESIIRSSVPLNEKFSIQDYLKRLDIVTDGTISEDGSLTGAHKKFFAQFTVYIDLVSMIKTRHLTKAEALSLFIKYLVDARLYLANRVDILDIVKVAVSVAYKLAKDDQDVDKEKNLLAKYDEDIVRVTSADSLLTEILKLVLELNLQRAYSKSLNYAEDPLFVELELGDNLAKATSKMSGTNIDVNTKTDHKELVDTCLDILALRTVFACFQQQEDFENSLSSVIKQNGVSTIDVDAYDKTETESGKESDKFIKFLLLESAKRLKANPNLSEDLRQQHTEEISRLAKSLKKQAQDKSLKETVGTECINPHSANLSNKYMQPALEMIYPQRHNDPAFLAVDNIFTKCLDEVNKSKIDSYLKDLVNVVEKRFGIKLASVGRLEREFNYYAHIPIISESSQLLTGLYNNYDHELMNEIPDAYTSTNLVSRLLKNKNINKVSLDLKNAKWHGLTNVAEENIFIALDIGASRLAGMTPRELSAIFFHELGHIFTHYEYSYRANKTNILLLEIFENMNNSSGNVDYIFERVGKLTDGKCDKKQIEEALKNPNKKAIFLGSLSYTAYSAFTQDIRRNLVTVSNSEQLADSFASRLGYESEILLGLDKLIEEIARQNSASKADVYKNYNESYNALFVMKLIQIAASISPIFFMLKHLLISMNPPLMVALIIKSILIALFIKLGFQTNSLDKTVTNVDLDYNSVKRSTRAIREVIKKLKDSNLSKEETKRLLQAHAALEKLIEEIAGYVKDVNKHSVIDNVHSNIANLLLTSGVSRADTDLYYLQMELEKLIDNDLFVSSAKLKNRVS